MLGAHGRLRWPRKGSLQRNLVGVGSSLQAECRYRLQTNSIQEAQLSQRGRATVSVVETLKRSLAVTLIENGAIRKPRYGFHGNYGRIFSRFDTIHERDANADTARHQEPRYTASLGCSRAVKSTEGTGYSAEHNRPRHRTALY